MAACSSSGLGLGRALSSSSLSGVGVGMLEGEVDVVVEGLTEREGGRGGNVVNVLRSSRMRVREWR